MMYLTWFGANSWFMEIANTRILLDPWLVDSLVFGNMTWLFEGKRQKDYPIPENFDFILLSQGLEDHAHPPTLSKINKNIPVVGSPNAVKVVEKLGFKNITTLAHGDSFRFANKVEIMAFPGSPIGMTLIENGYLIKDLMSDKTIYYEPHGYHSESMAKYNPIDAIITPIINLNLLLLGAFIKGQESALAACKLFNPQVIIPTTVGGDITYDGLLNNILRSQGTIAEFKSMLAANNLDTKIVEPIIGKPISVELDHR